MVDAALEVLDGGDRPPWDNQSAHETEGSALPAPHLPDDSPSVSWDRARAAEFVRRQVEQFNLEVFADRSLRIEGQSAQAYSPDDVGRVLETPRVDFAVILDRLRLTAAANSLRLPVGELGAALRHHIEDQAAKRKRTILEPLYAPLNDEERAQTDRMWAGFAEMFDMPSMLSIAGGMHFIWQVKSKLIGRLVTWHLAPVIFGPGQGSGKTTFVKMLLGPLQELGRGIVLIEQFCDGRNFDLYDLPAVFLDDIGRANEEQASKIKALVTAEDYRNRKQHTSKTQSIFMRSTLIATSNRPIGEVIPDPTGHRRFLTMPLKNPNPAAENREIWSIGSGLHFPLLWRSVDPFQPSPIEACIPELLAYQRAGQVQSDVEQWLRQLDLDSPAAWDLRSSRGIQVTDFFELYCDQTEIHDATDAIRPAFFKEMQRLVDETWCPLEHKRNAKRRFYRMKPLRRPGTASEPTVTAPLSASNNLPSPAPTVRGHEIR